MEDHGDAAKFLADEINGELCYVQTSDGKIVSIHYGVTDNYEGVNIKRSIASAFQANFDSNKEDVEEADAGSTHISHYRYKLMVSCCYTCISTIYYGSYLL